MVMNAADCPQAVSVPNRQIAVFLIISFVAGFALQTVSILQGMEGPGKLFLGITMWVPAISALLAGQESRALVWSTLKRVGFKYLLLALLLGWAVYLIQYLVLFVLPQGQWNHSAFEIARGGGSIKSIHRLRMLLGTGEQSFPFFALNLFLTMSFGSIIVAAIGAIGEELGWRSVLQHYMSGRFGHNRGTLVVGVIWSVWHLPANLCGYNDPAHPVINTFVNFTMHTLALSFLLTYLVSRSKSIWPAALAHGANNTIASASLMVSQSWLVEEMISKRVGDILVIALFARVLRRRRGRDGA